MKKENEDRNLIRVAYAVRRLCSDFMDMLRRLILLLLLLLIIGETEMHRHEHKPVVADWPVAAEPTPVHCLGRV